MVAVPAQTADIVNLRRRVIELEKELEGKELQLHMQACLAEVNATL